MREWQTTEVCLFLLELAAGTFLALSFVACEHGPGHVVASHL